MAQEFRKVHIVAIPENRRVERPQRHVADHIVVVAHTIAGTTRVCTAVDRFGSSCLFRRPEHNRRTLNDGRIFQYLIIYLLLPLPPPLQFKDRLVASHERFHFQQESHQFFY